MTANRGDEKGMTRMIGRITDGWFTEETLAFRILNCS